MAYRLNFETNAGVEGKSEIRSRCVVPAPALFTYGNESFVFTVDGREFSGNCEIFTSAADTASGKNNPRNFNKVFFIILTLI